ncbi:PPE family protein [Colletotrichum tofieldiae]|nr:PPE family protein [Colletotrichum tofieldiae]GKT71480.1 PPE family protein [Colletotrichum tofieldiae]GKT95366.1 PPE family protein [Colletotrichum tofieldiae]
MSTSWTCLSSLSLGTNGLLYPAISQALVQAQKLRTTLSAAESVLLIQRLNNEVVQSYSSLLQALDSRRSQIGQAPTTNTGLLGGLLGATSLLRGIFNNLNLSLTRQIALNEQLVKVLDPAYQTPGRAVTEAMQNLMKISISIYQV